MATPIINAQLDTLNGVLERQNILLSEMVAAASSEATPVATLNEIHEIVENGEAPHVFNIGDQINVNYNNGASDFVLPFDIVHFGNVDLQDGETVPGMFIQSHYAMQPVQFDGNEAFYVDFDGNAYSDLPAGTYHFTMGNSWGTNVVSGKAYEFITTKTGKMFLLGLANGSTTGGLPDQSPSNWRVFVYDSQTATSPLETVSLTEGSGGTDLGTLSSSTKYGTTGMNNMQRASYGYNRYGQSAMEQWLNSAAAVGSWWTPKNPFDRPPDQLSSLRGFMAGFDEAFLNILKPVKVRTALNTVTDGDIGTYEDVYNTFFPASLEQEYIVPQLASAEGEYWEYWKRRLGLTTPQAQGTGGTNAAHIRYAYENHASAQNCRLRSAGRGHASHAWYVNSTGNADTYGATAAIRPAPACVIC